MNYAVLTACLNSGATIERSINSVLRQATPPAEYIFIDGGSSDRTTEIIENAGKECARGNAPVEFRIISQKERTGITGAWNLGLKAAKAEIIFILNSDDWYEPDAASEVMGCFRSCPETEIVVSSAFFHDGDRKRRRDTRSFRLFPVLMPVIHPGCFVKKSVYDRLGFFNERYRISADYDFLYRCHAEGAVFREIRKPLVNMELGGTANRNRTAARRETLEIARRCSPLPLLPEVAWLARCVSGR